MIGGGTCMILSKVAIGSEIKMPFIIWQEKPPKVQFEPIFNKSAIKNWPGII